jgi:hypothetical protein
MIANPWTAETDRAFRVPEEREGNRRAREVADYLAGAVGIAIDFYQTFPESITQFGPVWTWCWGFLARAIGNGAEARLLRFIDSHFSSIVAGDTALCSAEAPQYGELVPRRLIHADGTITPLEPAPRLLPQAPSPSTRRLPELDYIAYPFGHGTTEKCRRKYTLIISLLSDRFDYWRRLGLQKKPTPRTMAIVSVLLGNLDPSCFEQLQTARQVIRAEEKRIRAAMPPRAVFRR